MLPHFIHIVRIDFQSAAFYLGNPRSGFLIMTNENNSFPTNICVPVGKLKVVLEIDILNFRLGKMCGHIVQSFVDKYGGVAVGGHIGNFKVCSTSKSRSFRDLFANRRKLPKQPSH